ncbi:hypothetical protein Tco_1390317, partial [Tanacetum coccineum]
LLQRLHAIVKAATEVDGCYRGCHIGYCEGYNGACWLMRRMSYKFPANVKAATKPYGLCKSCHIDYRLLRRLPHRLKADAKAAIKVAGFYKGCHIAKKVATLLKRLYRGYGIEILHKINPNRGSYEGPTDGATDYAKRGTYQAMMVICRDVGGSYTCHAEIMGGSYGDNAYLPGGAFYGAFDRAFDEAFYEAFYRAFYGAFEEKARGSSRRRPWALTGPFTGKRPGTSRRRLGVFSELNKATYQSDGNAHKRSGGYVIRWHLEEIHVTWAHLEKKRTRLQTYTKSMKKYCSQSVETASKAYSDTVVTYPVTTSEI